VRTNDAAAPSRVLPWPGCFNVRDLGGLPTVDGGRTAWRVIVRGDNPARLTAAGRAALTHYGVRTLVDLRQAGEGVDADAWDGLTIARVPVFDFSEACFWARCQRLHPSQAYREALLRWPEAFCRAVTEVATARPGGVLVYCEAGRDRTGLVCALILSAAGVTDDAIAHDYSLSAPFLRDARNHISAAEDPRFHRLITHRNFSEFSWMARLIADLGFEQYLKNGLSSAVLETLRSRLRDRGEGRQQETR